MNRVAKWQPETLLRAWRKAHGLSLQDVADLIGVSTSLLSRAERGERRLSPRLKVAFARRLGVGIKDLFRPEPLQTERLAPNPDA
jgi:transcriptional regulator with XRE-family HTH domain